MCVAERRGGLPSIGCRHRDVREGARGDGLHRRERVRRLVDNFASDGGLCLPLDRYAGGNHASGETAGGDHGKSGSPESGREDSGLGKLRLRQGLRRGVEPDSGHEQGPVEGCCRRDRVGR